jgi:hypothetical protein
MDHWISVELHQRREELHAQVAHARIIRMLESGRSSSIRGRIADSAEALSQLLACFAQAVRDREA